MPARRHSSSEDDDLLPHRESAWALLEERVRDPSTFCDAVVMHPPDLVATALGPAQGALTAVADSLAAHSAGCRQSLYDRPWRRLRRIPGSDEPLFFDAEVKVQVNDCGGKVGTIVAASGMRGAVLVRHGWSRYGRSHRALWSSVMSSRFGRDSGCN